MQLTRRELLGAIGLGTLGVGGFALGRDRPQYTYYTYAAHGDVDDHRLRIAWYERYNGQFRESHGGTADEGFDATLDPDTEPAYLAEASFVVDAAGPVVTVGNVLPGDRGTLVVGLEAADDGDFIPEPLDVWLQAAVTGDEERGVNGPEAAAGDTAATGELDDELRVELWRDGSPLGSCDGEQDFIEDFEAPLVPQAPLSVAFAGSAPAGSDTGLLAIEGLQPGESRCVALAWTFPEATATNRSQGDSVAFDVRFGGVGTGTPSPFGGEGA